MESKKTVSAKSGDTNLDKAAALMAMLNEHQFFVLEYEEKDFKIKLEKYPSGGAAVSGMSVLPAMTAPVPAVPAATAAADKDSGLTPIKSPIVGTFYASPSPDSAPFISVGDKVKVDTIVCIIEAMKIMNEIKAELSGTVEKVLVANGDPIEYGQPLFLVRK